MVTRDGCASNLVQAESLCGPPAAPQCVTHGPPEGRSAVVGGGAALPEQERARRATALRPPSGLPSRFVRAYRGEGWKTRKGNRGS
jgi:hypothetical protein